MSSSARISRFRKIAAWPYSEDTMNLRNVVNHSPNNTASQPRRLKSLAVVLNLLSH